MSHEYENFRRVVYEGKDWLAQFIPVCETCGRFVKPDKKVLISEDQGVSDEPNATCKKCGRVHMLFEGFFSP